MAECVAAISFTDAADVFVHSLYPYILFYWPSSEINKILNKKGKKTVILFVQH